MSTADLRSLEKALRKRITALKVRKRELERTRTLLQPIHAEKQGILLEQILKGEFKIFRDPSALQASTPAKMPLGRERQLTFMARMVAQAIKTGKGRNLFLCGKPGTGKTHALLYLLHVIRAHASVGAMNLRLVYVNAGLTRNPYFTLMEILKQLGVGVPSSGWQMTRLKQELERIIVSAPILAAIDEVDAILFKEREPLVYYLNRLPNVTLILVSNRFEDLAELPARAKSSLQPVPVLFSPYTAEELCIILKRRAKAAFQPGALPSKLVDLVAEEASKTGDIRAAFNMLLTAGTLAEQANAERICEKHLTDAAKIITYTS